MSVSTDAAAPQARGEEGPLRLRTSGGPARVRELARRLADVSAEAGERLKEPGLQGTTGHWPGLASPASGVFVVLFVFQVISSFVICLR